MGRVTWESRLPIFFLMVHFGCFLFFYIGIYSGGKISSFFIFYFLMVFRLFVKKVVPLYIKEKEIVLTK
jgi:hypothetical protein